MYRKAILESQQKAQAKAYTPAFRVEKEAPGWRIFDGKRAIGFFADRSWFFFDLWAFSLFAPDIKANADWPTTVFDLHTMHNTDVNLPFTTGRDLVAGVADPFAAMKVKWIRARGTSLELGIDGTFTDGQQIAYRFRIVYDPAWSAYRFFLDADVWKREPQGMEPINMMMAGALTCRAAERRWSHSVWQDPDGQLRNLVHSNALFCATDFTHHGGGEWRTKYAALNGGWIAYVAHDTFNPAMVIHETNVPVTFATCSQLFDEHLIWQNAAMEHLDENGYFHFVMRTELVNLPADLARKLLRKSQAPVKPTHWRQRRVVLPFEMDRVNSFEVEVDLWKPEECPILILDSPEQWAKGIGHSGKRSLQLTGTSPSTWQKQFPAGAVCRVEPNKRYRFSAWVKTEGVERFARLDLFSYEYTYNNVIDLASSARLSGTHGWAHLSVELDSGDEAYLMPQFALYGCGTAWFDDAQLCLIES